MTSLIVLARVLVAVGQALQEAEPDQLQPAQGAKARKAKRKAAPETTEAAPPSADMNWDDLVEPCSIAEATRATELLKVARAKLGRTEAQLRFGREKQTVLQGSDGKKRRVCKAGLPRGQAWKLKE
jgi:hypothetical protein